MWLLEAVYVPVLTIFSCNFIQFHKVWGQLMKTGYQNSRFAHQVWLYLKSFTFMFQEKKLPISNL